MSKGLVFWLLMTVWLVLSIHFRWPRVDPATTAGEHIDTALVFVLLFLLGWAIFGFAIK